MWLASMEGGVGDAREELGMRWDLRAPATPSVLEGFIYTAQRETSQ